MKTDLATRLLRLRVEAGITQVEACARLKRRRSGPRITQGHLSRLESGRNTRPTMQTIIALAAIYTVSPLWLMTGEGGGGE